MSVNTSKNIQFPDDEIKVVAAFDMPSNRRKEEAVHDFKSVMAEFAEDEWIFRAIGRWNIGWENPKNELDKLSISSTFDDAWQRTEPENNSADRYLYESWMLMEFKREAHRFLNRLPEKDDFLEWMALARQYEMPSRLLDFSYSFYVAAYFALSLRRRNEDACILAINLSRLMKDAQSKLERSWKHFGIEGMSKLQASFHDKRIFHAFAFNNHLEDAKFKPGLYCAPVNPLSRNPRLGAQQAVFLCPADVNASFEENLRETLVPLERNVKKLIRIKAEAKKNIILELRRMNVSIASLYTDLTGHAQSQRDLVHQKLDDSSGTHRAELKRAITMDCLI